MRSIKAVLFFLLFACNIFAAHATIRVGTVFLYPPFVISLNEGFDIELIHLLCQKMNTDCQLVPMDFEKLFTALDNGDIDVAIGGIVISKGREKKYIFTLPYMLSRGEFLVSPNSTATSINDLANKTIGVIKGEQDSTVFAGFLNENYPGLFTIQSFDDMEDLITALSSNTIAAAFMHEATAYYWQQNGGGQFHLLGKPMIVGEGISIMSTPSHADLIAQLNQQLLAAEQDGSYLNIFRVYFGAEQ
ncbi:transporter substrate-binding domain-containing protein [Legionella hackeliae]|uniref:Putative arginine-binding periplasmic protein n=1 Tax=Legionella hackeliae TaxID=449 RepID=A0A0A8URC7_LEGHA|nr:transporter substrate-binding domain-containing protein [Legionella hackeliae]KTD13490.1 arginine-binding periplasmic protein [Legionella hackeliae]CEK09334.1 putative arginine-binding periplasmic protein [Legionella hackeliae]STX49240.1 arginine-binding periplasmic protein [Legionella hackeliae]